jgi:hypothetical protein
VATNRRPTSVAALPALVAKKRFQSPIVLCLSLSPTLPLNGGGRSAP